MAQYELLNNIDHRDLRVAAGHGTRYGDAVNQTIVFPTEFEELQREYAILLRRNDKGAYRFTVLLGLDPDENLFLDGERWDARGPFAIRDGADGAPMVHVERDHPRIAAEGAPVFREHGGNAPLLEHVTGVLQRIWVGSRLGGPLIDAWSALDLIAPVALQLDLDEARRVNVPDCFTIDSARLATLDGPALAALHRDDLLRPAIWVASSLGNVQSLIDRKLRRDRDG